MEPRGTELRIGPCSRAERDHLLVALVAAAEALAAQAGHDRIGLAVDPDHPANRRLYARLGYEDSGVGPVVDSWTEHRDDGTDDGTLVPHADPSLHLIKALVEPPHHRT
jgi:hypothetical protein